MSAEVNRTGTVADYSDDQLLSRAVWHCVASRGRMPAWTRVSRVFGLGSTYASQLCRRFGFDPETGKELPK